MAQYYTKSSRRYRADFAADFAAYTDAVADAMPATRIDGQHGGSMCFSPLFPVLSSLAACQMPPKPCAQFYFAAIIVNISRQINSHLAANDSRFGGKTTAYTKGAMCVHWRKEALTLAERRPYTRRHASLGDILLTDACGRTTIRPATVSASPSSRTCQMLPVWKCCQFQCCQFPIVQSGFRSRSLNPKLKNHRRITNCARRLPRSSPPHPTPRCSA